MMSVKNVVLISSVMEPYCNTEDVSGGDDPGYQLSYSLEGDYNLQILDTTPGRTALAAIASAALHFRKIPNGKLRILRKEDEFAIEPLAVQFERDTGTMPLLNIQPDVDPDNIPEEDKSAFHTATILNVGYHIRSDSEPEIISTCGVLIETGGVQEWMLMPVETHPHYTTLMEVAVGKLFVPEQLSFGYYYKPEGSEYNVLLSLSGSLEGIP